MASEPDPYRTLGLSPGAPLDEVKRAYRRLAKANHPDAAGEAALSRFLAIQAAYDQIAGPDASGGGGPGARSADGSGARRPWDADPGRAGATHRAYGGRTRRARSAGGPRPGTAPPQPPPAGGSGPRSRRADRPPNKATLGSTSYDGADAEPFEPDWGGASWYGTTSGTYWTLNPKEYADPRKHGPEYQARGRRRQPGAPPGPDEPVEPPSPPTDGADDATDRPDAATGRGNGPPPRPTTPPPTHTTASWWDATAGDSPGDQRRGGASAAGPADSPDPPHATRPGFPDAGAATFGNASLTADAALAALRSWLDDGRPGVIGRVGRAAFGWAPLALGIGWVAGEVSGCGRFSAGCDPAVAPISWFAQLVALLVLLAVPRLARVAAVATIATIAVAVSGALLLSATGSEDATMAGRTALGGLIVIAWGVGLAVAVWREVRAWLRAAPVS